MAARRAGKTEIWMAGWTAASTDCQRVALKAVRRAGCSVAWRVLKWVGCWVAKMAACSVWQRAEWRASRRAVRLALQMAAH